MLLALTGYQTALVVVAASFIVFALVMALVVPRSRPSFPGNRLGIFLVVCVLFFAAQLTAVLVLAEIGEADEPAVAEETTTGEETTTTETTRPTDGVDHHRDDPRRPSPSPPRRPRRPPKPQATPSPAKRSSWANPAARAATRSPTRDRRARSGRISTR